MVLAVFVAGAVAVGSGGLGGGTAGSPGSGITSSKDAASKGNQGEAWRRMGLTAVKRAVRQHVNCVVHSFGQVREFFVHNPCRSLERALLAIGDGNGNIIAVSIAWVRMRTTDAAQSLKTLADTDGTGNVSPLGGELLGLSGVKFAGKFYESRRSGTLVVIAEATPGSGRPDPQIMDDAADIAALFPSP